KVTSIMEPYHFLRPPAVRAEGIIPLNGDVPADLHFKIDGGPFQWMKFNLAHISGAVDWVGDHLHLSGVNSSFYDGQLTGTAAFDFSRGRGTEFSFDTIVTDVNLQALIRDLFVRTNHLEGLLNGHLSITQANSADWQSWFGRGQVTLTNGLIWEIPIFGILSEPLDRL